jgi:hypothetical protein
MKPKKIKRGIAYFLPDSDGQPPMKRCPQCSKPNRDGDLCLQCEQEISQTLAAERPV